SDIDDGEDNDPHRVDEVPVEAHCIPRHRSHGARATEMRDQQRRERDEAGQDVDAVQPREREEGRAEKRASRADPLTQKPRVFAALSDEEYRTEDHRGGEPRATPGPARERHRPAAREERDRKDRGTHDVEVRSRRRQPGVAVRDVREDDREKEDRFRRDEDDDPQQNGIFNDPRAALDRDCSAHRWSLASGCFRSQSGRRPVTAEMLAKFSGGGGDVVAHSSVNASHGSSPAISPERRLRTRFTKKTTIATARIAAPIVEMKLSGPQPVLAAYVNTRRGIPA